MTLRETLRAAFLEALQSLDFAGAVRDAIADVPAELARERVFAIAIGKAAPAMMQGALASWGARIERAIVVCPDQTPCPLDEDARLEVLRAGHPLPDARSVDAAARLLALAHGASREDLLLVLVSGGASALACAPHAGLGFDTKLDATHALLDAGASIEEFNTVRRHLSRIKGGGLTRATRGHVTAFLASDVIGGAPHDIGSGPTTPDPTTIADARAVLARYAPQFSSMALVESLKPTDEAASRERHSIVIGPDVLVDHAARSLARCGLSPSRLSPSKSSVSDLAGEYARLARSLGPGEARLRVAEPSLRVDASPAGRGGRSGHLAAVLAPRLAPGTVFLAGASDGADGTSGAAGAIVDPSFLTRISMSSHADHIARFDTAALHEVAGTAIFTGPTGVNLCDLHILARAPDG